MFKVKYIHEEEDNILVIKVSDFVPETMRTMITEKSRNGMIQYRNEDGDVFTFRQNTVLYISIGDNYGNNLIVDFYFPQTTKCVSYAIDLCTRYTKDYYIENLNKLFEKFSE